MSVVLNLLLGTLSVMNLVSVVDSAVCVEATAWNSQVLNVFSHYQ